MTNTRHYTSANMPNRDNNTTTVSNQPNSRSNPSIDTTNIHQNPQIPLNTVNNNNNNGKTNTTINSEADANMKANLKKAVDDAAGIDKTIHEILQSLHSSGDLHSLNSIENLTLENSMDNSAKSSRPYHLPHSRSTIDVPGQTKSKISPNGLINDLNSKLVIVMVGLPARGKSYLTKKITRYLNWLQYNTKIFNVGNTRRLSNQNLGPADRPFEMSNNDHDASFFDPKNQSSLQIRELWAMNTLDQLIKYLTKEEGTVGIFDATNTTKLRRRHIIEAIRAKTPDHSNLKILFLESICTNKKIINRNMRLKLSGPDYKDKNPEIALKDFRNRLQNYEKAYETIDDEEEEYYESINENLQYIKIINAGKKITSYNISGFLSSQVIFFMLNFNLNERQIWIARHGETYDNLNGKLGSSKQGSKLTPLGEKYSKALAKFMNFKKKEFRLRQLKKHCFEEQYLEEEEEREQQQQQQNGAGRPQVVTEQSTKSQPRKRQIKIVPELHFSVWSSMLRQTVQTSNAFNERDFNIKQLKMLNELSHGKVNGMTLKKFAAKFPQDFKNYQGIYQIDDKSSSSRKKLLYRFPGGESYLDVINRLRPLIVELERMEDHALLITHKVVARVLLSYFMNLDKEYITELDVPLHSIYVLEPRPYGVDWNMYQYDEELNWFYAVDKDKILRKKQKREVIPTELVDLYSSNLKRKQSRTSRTNFYIESPSEPSTPMRTNNRSRVNFSEMANIVFANSNSNSIVNSEDEKGDNSSTDEDEDSYSSDSDDEYDVVEAPEDDANNEHWYYQLDNEMANVNSQETDDFNNNLDNSSSDEESQSNNNSLSSSSYLSSNECMSTHHNTSLPETDVEKQAKRNKFRIANLVIAENDEFPATAPQAKAPQAKASDTNGVYPNNHIKSGSASPAIGPCDDDGIDGNICTKFSSRSSSSISYNTPKTMSVSNSDVNLKVLPETHFESLDKQISENFCFSDEEQYHDSHSTLSRYGHLPKVKPLGKGKQKLSISTSVHS